MKTLTRTLLSSAIAAFSCAAIAAAPMAKTPSPGYYRMMLGDFEVTALSDGTFDLPVDKLLHEKPAKVEKALKDNFLKLPVETSVNAFLVNTGSKLVLIDAGAGALFGPTVGKLQASLKAAGYKPEQVDEIYITHLHGDHVGGLGGGSAAFPNAVVRVDKDDAAHWLSKEKMDAAPPEAKSNFQGPMTALEPYIKAGRFKTFDAGSELVPGVRNYPTHGHTPGHSSYVVESKGQKLVVIGDLIHVGAVQLADPTVTIQFDSDSKVARSQRLKVFAEAAKEGSIVGAAHLQFPGLGHLKAAGKSYQWIPVNYTRMP
jgi:glyoxylase-like metal-dependent hydrolase (beta-lactamase superfamily II)